MSRADIRIWPGSSSFAPGDTPYGFYDNDVCFQNDVDKVALYCARRLGYPIIDVELQDINFYTAFEEAISEYAAQVNLINARDQLLGMSGMPTGSVNLTGEFVEQSAKGLFRLAKQYGTEFGAGGNLTWYTGSISITDGQQIYDFTDTDSVTLEAGDFSTDVFTIRKIFYEATPAVTKYFDPTLGTGFGGGGGMLQAFGLQGNSPPMSFMMYPIHYDVLRMQSVEFHEQIRKSAYSFRLTGNRLWIFPIPTDDYTLYFNYTLDDDILNDNVNNSNDGLISDISNMPYANIKYANINSLGQNWIRRYTLALCKEMLGWVRSKYSTVPIPGNEVTLNGQDLLNEAEAEKERLVTELREFLESVSKQALLERKQAESDALRSQLLMVPTKIYVR